MRIISLIFLVSLLMTTQACGKKSKKSKSNVQVSTYYVQGDPKAVLAGSTLNQSSFLTNKNVNEFNGFELNGVMTFAEQEEIVVPTNIEEGNEATSTNELEKETQTFTFQLNDDNTYTLKNPQLGLSFHFQMNNESLHFNAITVSENGASQTFPLEVLHYSVKNDRKAFSLLAALNDERGRNLVSLTFVKPSPINSSIGDKQYLYLAGPGVKVQWDQSKDLVVNVCDQKLSAVPYTYTKGVQMWKAPLTDRLNFKLHKLSSYPPFSDLNVNCIYNVDSYLTTPPEGNFSNPGTTLPIIDRFTSRFVDADIFVWKREFEKIGLNYENSEQASAIIGHEFGHLLGLHHQFDDQIKSLMGYEGIDYITDYDRNAIQGLYPKLK